MSKIKVLTSAVLGIILGLGILPFVVPNLGYVQIGWLGLPLAFLTLASMFTLGASPWLFADTIEKILFKRAYDHNEKIDWNYAYGFPTMLGIVFFGILTVAYPADGLLRLGRDVFLIIDLVYGLTFAALAFTPLFPNKVHEDRSAIFRTEMPANQATEAITNGKRRTACYW